MDECHSCGAEKEQLGTHWSQTECDYPKLSDYQHQVVTGLLMGDGSVNRGSGNPYIQCGMTNKKYLNYLDSVFPIMGLGVRTMITAEESANDKTPLTPANDDPSKYSDVYQWITRRNPNIDIYSDWYDNGKSFPEDIDLTPTVLKHWYCGDGNLNISNGTPTVRIYTKNEINNKEKIEKYFNDNDLPCPSWTSNQLYWGTESSVELLEYMNDPLPGFEYKWNVRR